MTTVLTKNLMQYQLNDPITQLSLMTNNQLIDHLSKYQIESHPIPISTMPIEMPNQHMNNLHINDIIKQDDNFTEHLESQRRLVYEIIQTIIKHYHEDQNGDWAGQYIQNINGVLISDQTSKVYYIKIDINANDYDTNIDELIGTIYQSDLDDANDLVVSILANNLDTQFKPNSLAFNALKNFWVAQANTLSYEIDDDMHEANENNHYRINQALQNILTSVINAPTNQRVQRQYHLTYQMMVTFYQEIQNRKLTDATRDVQDWLFGDKTSTNSVNDILALLQYHDNFKSLSNRIEQITDHQIPEIMDQFEQDSYFPKRNDYNIDVYKLNEPQKRYDQNAKHFEGIHGTNAFSIPTILCDGFKTNTELQQSKDVQYQDTGQSLGDGTYFARLDQASKALSYANHNTSFLLVADIAYTNPIHTTTYTVSKKPHDFVIAESVGISHRYDEYVATNPKTQVTLKYLILITKKNIQDE